MRILLTGGAGFIGSHFCEHLLQSGHEVVVLDNFNDYYDPAIKRRNIAGFAKSPAVRIIDGDILDEALLQRLFADATFDAIVHLAARAGVRPSLQEPILYERVNVHGTMLLLEAARQHGVGKIVIASSSSVYGANTKVPFAETDPVDNPISPYAATKKACELIAYTYHHLYKLHITCLRFFTVYGPRQRPDMAIHKFARLIMQGKPIPVFGDGTTRRDYTYIGDITDGISRSLARCSGYHIYNLGESKTWALKELLEVMQQKLDRKANIQHLPMQPGDVPITYADISKARAELGYNPQVDIEEGITRFVEWFKENDQRSERR